MKDESPLPKKYNMKTIRKELDLIEEKRFFTTITSVTLKQVAAAKYNKKVRPYNYQPDNLILHMADNE